ncbi:MAG TPA: hypothetical protein DCG57_11400 [Candidatus Riflebacteria bacterium]|nr:hypothetical protein [Candidatus Riflebacteria bacterium]
MRRAHSRGNKTRLIKHGSIMSSRLIGVLLIIISILAFHLLGSQPETQALWQRSITEKIYSDPVSVGDRAVFVAGDKGKREYRLYEIDSSGNTTAQSVQLTNLPYDPTGFTDIVVIGDRARMIRGFSVPGLQLVWESGTIDPFNIPPLKTGENLLIQSDASTLFCLSSKDGKPVWDYTFTDKLVNYGVDKTVVCLHGYSDLKNPNWKATGIDPETGEVLWTITRPLSSDAPVFVQNICVLTSSEGEMLVVDQFNGNILFQNQIKGLKAAQILDEYLIMLAAGGSRLLCMSLMDGKSWTTTMQSNLTGLAKSGNRLLIADKKNLRCLKITDGTSFWTRNLEDVYNAVAYRNGIFITHKDSFFSRNTFGSYIEADSPNSRWVAHDKSNFLKPLLTNSGELLLSYNGSIRMLPRTAAAPAPGIADMPGQKINTEPSFWKDKNATESSTLPASNTASLADESTDDEDDDEEPADAKPSVPEGLKPAADDWGKKD